MSLSAFMLPEEVYRNRHESGRNEHHLRITLSTVYIWLFCKERMRVHQ